MGATPDFNRPDWNNSLDEDLDWIRDNFNFLLCSAATGSPVLPGWNTAVDVDTNNDYSQPDGYVLSNPDGRKIYINLVWADRIYTSESPVRTESVISQITLGYDDGVSSPGLQWFDPVTLTIEQAASGTPITDGLGAWYKLDETSGNTRVNSHATYSPNLYDLSEDVAVGSVAGVISNAAEFTGASSPRGGILYCTEATSPLPELMAATTICGCCWAKTDVAPTTQPKYIIRRGKYAPTGVLGDVEWAVMFAKSSFVSPEGIRARVGIAKSGVLNKIADELDTEIVNGTMYFIYWYYDYATGMGGISVNNGTIYTTGYDADPIGNQYGTIMLGSYSDSSSTYDANRLDGAVDEVGLWYGRTLSATDITNLYNAGAGVTYEDLTWSS